MRDLEYSFLCACYEVVCRQQELVPVLAHTLGVQPQEVFYHWVVPPRCHQTGIISDTLWRYFFHGYECNLKHLSDGRFLRIDFGPSGRFDTFTGWGVLQFIMTSKAPWSEFSELRQYLAKEPPPFDELSGSHEKMKQLWERMVALRWVEVVAPELCQLKEKHTTIDAEGRSVVILPEEYSDFNSHKFWDIAVSYRWVLSDLGKQKLEED